MYILATERGESSVLVRHENPRLPAPFEKPPAQPQQIRDLRFPKTKHHSRRMRPRDQQVDARNCFMDWKPQGSPILQQISHERQPLESTRYNDPWTIQSMVEPPIRRRSGWGDVFCKSLLPWRRVWGYAPLEGGRGTSPCRLSKKQRAAS